MLGERERKLLWPKSVFVSLPRYLAFQFASPPSPLPPRCKGVAFQFFPPSNKINPLRAIDRVNFRERGSRYAAHHHQFSTAKRRSAHPHPLPPAKFHAVQLAANHSTWPIYYPTIVTGLIRRLIRPRPRNYGLFNRGFSPGMHDFTIVHRRFEGNLSNYRRIGKDSKRKVQNFREIG